MKSPVDIVDAIQKLGLPKVMAEIWSSVYAPRPFFRYYRCPNGFVKRWYGLGNLDSRYRDCLPLVEPGDDAVYAYDYAESVYIERYFDDKEPTVIGPYFSQLVAFIFANLADSGLESVAIDASSLLEFDFVEEYCEYCRKAGSGDPLRDRKEFVESIGLLESCSGR